MCVKLKPFLASRSKSDREKTLPPYRINYMDSPARSHSEPRGMKKSKGRKKNNEKNKNLRYSLVGTFDPPLKGRKFGVAERLHLRAQGIALVFASYTDMPSRVRGGLELGEISLQQEKTHSAAQILYRRARPWLMGLFVKLSDGVSPSPSPKSHPAEISKLKRPKGDINSWHPGAGELT